MQHIAFSFVSPSWSRTAGRWLRRSLAALLFVAAAAPAHALVEGSEPGMLLGAAVEADDFGPVVSFAWTPGSFLLQAGTSASFALSALDAHANIVTDYIGTVHFTSNDFRAVLPANYTFAAGDLGTHTFAATFNTVSSTSMITAIDTVNPSVSGALVGVVFPGPPVSLSVTAQTLTQAGTASSFTVSARDASGNVATGYRGTVRFTSNDPQAVLPASYTFVAGDNGTHIFSGTLKTVSTTATITVTDTVTPALTGSAVGTVVPGPAKKLALQGASFQSLGRPFSFTLVAQDLFFNVATGYRGTVHFSSNDPNAVLPANYTFVASDAGVHNFSTTFRTALDVPITLFVTDAGNGLDGSLSFAVSAVPEPGMLSMMLAGLLALVPIGRRSRRSSVR